MSKIAALFAQQELFNRYISVQERSLSAFHFSSLVAWSDFFDFSFEIIDGRLCIFAVHEPGSFLYLPPLGGIVSQAVVDACFERMGQASRVARVARIENVVQAECNSLDVTRLDCIFKADEYLYRKADIALMSGGNYKSQRHDINHLHKRHQVQYLRYEPKHLGHCLDLYERWSANRRLHNNDTVYQAMLEDNAKAHRLILQHERLLGLEGRVVMADGKLCAYSFGYPLNAGTFCVLLEISDLEVKGAGSFIFQQFCADPCWQDFNYVNAMDDFGLPNVARAKQAYHPVQLIPSYTIYPRAG